MYRKTCPHCKGDSYSSCAFNWICPYCGVDLSALCPQPAWYAPDKVEGEYAGKIKLLPIRLGGGREFIS